MYLSSNITYKDYTNQNHEICPFCSQKNSFVEIGEYSNVVLNRGPYCRDHLLVYPKKHIVKIGELSKDELAEIMFFLQKYSIMIYGLGYTDLAILMRDGPIKKNEKDDKTIEHMHWHIIPELNIGGVDITDEESRNRKFMSDDEYEFETKSFIEINKSWFEIHEIKNVLNSAGLNNRGLLELLIRLQLRNIIEILVTRVGLVSKNGEMKKIIWIIVVIILLLTTLLIAWIFITHLALADNGR